MKLLRPLSLVLLASGLMLAQSTSNANPAAEAPSVAAELKALRQALTEQQDQIARQQQELERLRKQVAAREASASSGDAAPRVVDASLHNSGSMNAAAIGATDAPQEPKESPLSFRIGGTDFTPGGFVDFNNIFRTVNTGSSVGTAFGSIPFSNTPQGHLTEFRSTGQYSRWNMKVGGTYGENNLTGFIEGDFNGNDAANVFVTTNPHTLRLRLYYLNLKRGRWEFTAGQAWGLITPNKTGVSPMPSDLSTTASTDANIHVGMAYARDGQFRMAFHPNENFAWAVSVENPQQVTNGEVTTPTAFATALGTQIDGVATAGVPNAFPDIVTKMAWDSKLGGRAFHIEGGGLVTSAKVAVTPTGATQFVTHSTIGGGALAGTGLELVKNFRLVANGVYGYGVGRYFNGLGPSFVVRPVALTATTFDVATSMVHAGAGWGGFEVQARPKTQLAAYYGGQFYQRNAFPDITSGAAVKPIIGFGGLNSPTSNNRAIQEGSLVLTQTLWKNSQYGALLLINDASYSTRAPWFVALNTPKNAHMFMDHLVLRYVLP